MWRVAQALCLCVPACLGEFFDLLFQHQPLHIAGDAPMAPYPAHQVGGEVGIQVSVSVEVAAIMGLAVHIITVGPVVSLLLLVEVIHSGDVLLVCLYFDWFNGESSTPLNDCWIDWCERCTLRFLGSFCWCGSFLELGVLVIAKELFPLLIILVRATGVMAGGFGMGSAKRVFTIGVRDVAGGA